MTVSAVSPWRTALQRYLFSASVFGPALLSALRRLASICLYEVMENRSPNSIAGISAHPRTSLNAPISGDNLSARSFPVRFCLGVGRSGGLFVLHPGGHRHGEG